MGDRGSGFARRTNRFLELARMEMRIQNYGKAYDYYSQASEQNPQIVEAWLGRAATANSSARSQQGQARILSAGATSGDLCARIADQERDRISQESLACFEQACGLLQDKSGSIDGESLAAWAVRLAIVARGARLFYRSDLSRRDTAESCYEQEEIRTRLARFIQCLCCVWEIHPSMTLGQELKNCCDEYIALGANSAFSGFIGATINTIQEWMRGHGIGGEGMQAVK